MHSWASTAFSGILSLGDNRWVRGREKAGRRYSQKEWKEGKGGVSSWATKPTGKRAGQRQGDTAMQQHTTQQTSASSVLWEQLEAFV
jgi:hypothetical protein